MDENANIFIVEADEYDKFFRVISDITPIITSKSV